MSVHCRVHVDRRLDVDSVWYMAARATRLTDAVASVRRQPDSTNYRHRPGSRRPGGPWTRLRHHELSRLLRHLRRQCLLPRLREYRSNVLCSNVIVSSL